MTGWDEPSLYEVDTEIDYVFRLGLSIGLWCMAYPSTWIQYLGSAHLGIAICILLKTNLFTFRIINVLFDWYKYYSSLYI